MAQAPAKQSYSTDPALYIYTSLTAGSSHIVTATSRLETILKANRVPFKALDLATDEKARMLWGRRAGKDAEGRVRKLPGLVQMGLILGDLVEIEDWNEYGELKQHVKIYYDAFTIPAKGAAQIANPLKKPIYGKAQVGVPTAISSSSTPTPSSSSTPKPIPAAPPLPEKKEPATATKKAEVTKKPAAAAAAPVKSIAEEAAQKAKQVRLDGLRAAVAKDKEAAKGKEAAASLPKDGADGEKTAAAATTGKTPAPAADPSSQESSADSSSADGSVKGLTISAGGNKAASTAGLQSPTTGAWKTSPQEDSLRNVLQSPTSGTWKSGDSALALPIREHQGSSIVEGSKEEIAAIEKAEAIPESAVEDDEEDDEDESEDDSDEEEETEPERKM